MLRKVDLGRDERAVSTTTTDRRVTLQSGETLRYDALLLATKARPRRIDQPSAPGPKFHYLRNFAHAQTMSASIRTGNDVVIIGLKVAASLASR